MLVVLALAAIAVIAGVTMVAMGRGGELKEFPPDVPPLNLPEAGRLGAVDFMALQLPVSLVGYHTQSVDETLNRVAGALSERDTRIAVLEQRVSELLAGRLQARHELNPGLPVPARPGREAPYELSGTGGYGTSEELSNGPAVATDMWRRPEPTETRDLFRAAEDPAPDRAPAPGPDLTTGSDPTTDSDPVRGSDPVTGSNPVTGSRPDPAIDRDPSTGPDPVTDADSTPVSGVRPLSHPAPLSDSVPVSGPVLDAGPGVVRGSDSASDPAGPDAPPPSPVPPSSPATPVSSSAAGAGSSSASLGVRTGGSPDGERPEQERPEAEGAR